MLLSFDYCAYLLKKLLLLLYIPKPDELLKAENEGFEKGAPEKGVGKPNIYGLIWKNIGLYFMADEKVKLFYNYTLFAISENATVEFMDFWNII